MKPQNAVMDLVEETVIEPGGRGARYWREVWRFRELFYLLAWRDLLVRYKQTAVGVTWAVLRPLLAVAVFVFVFGKVAGFSSGEVPYSLLVLAGVLPWQFFASALTESGNSIVNNSNLIAKIYFPRLIIPSSAVITTFADFAIALGLLAVLMAWHGCWPGLKVLSFPVMLLLLLGVTGGTALWVSALMVRYRDLRFVLPFVVQTGFFLSPVGYASTTVPGHLRVFYCLNPITGVIDGFRWALLPSSGPLYWPSVVISAAIALILVGTGLAYFCKTERSFADVI